MEGKKKNTYLIGVKLNKAINSSGDYRKCNRVINKYDIPPHRMQKIKVKKYLLNITHHTRRISLSGGIRN